MLGSSLGLALLLPPCARLSVFHKAALSQMAASPDLSGSSTPVELKLRVVTTLPSAEDCGGKLSSSSEVEVDEAGEGECRTPTSKDSKIPAIVSCPPAPKKSRQMLVPCKRRMSDLELFSVGQELMCRLFRPLDAPSIVCLPRPPTATKKRKLCYQSHE